MVNMHYYFRIGLSEIAFIEYLFIYGPKQSIIDA